MVLIWVSGMVMGKQPEDDDSSGGGVGGSVEGDDEEDIEPSSFLGFDLFCLRLQQQLD